MVPGDVSNGDSRGCASAIRARTIRPVDVRACGSARHQRVGAGICLRLGSLGGQDWNSRCHWWNGISVGHSLQRELHSTYFSFLCFSVLSSCLSSQYLAYLSCSLSASLQEPTSAPRSCCLVWSRRGKRSTRTVASPYPTGPSGLLCTAWHWASTMGRSARHSAVRWPASCGGTF